MNLAGASLGLRERFAPIDAQRPEVPVQAPPPLAKRVDQLAHSVRTRSREVDARAIEAMQRAAGVEAVQPDVIDLTDRALDVTDLTTDTDPTAP